MHHLDRATVLARLLNRDPVPERRVALLDQKLAKPVVELANVSDQQALLVDGLLPPVHEPACGNLDESVAAVLEVCLVDGCRELGVALLLIIEGAAASAGSLGGGLLCSAGGDDRNVGALLVVG